MIKNGIIIYQLEDRNKGRNEYHFYLETGIYLGGLLFPCNGQYAFDDKMLDIITKALAVRWGLIKMKRTK